jgi:predicted glycoside hydrolase/deacetylase ChbG (UPF0249 family)
MKRLLFLISGICISLLVTAQSLSERLGYPSEAKLLIIHADDLAVAHSENHASFKAMETGSVNSASVMVPCPWLLEVGEYAKAHSDHDLGLHLTLTSEWKHYKWGPVSPSNQVSTLVNSYGHLYPDCPSMSAQATPEHVELELRAQITQALAVGLDPTHFDSHMGCLFFSGPESFEIYLRLAREYRVPAMVSHEFLRLLPEASRMHITPADILVDRIVTATPEDFQNGFVEYYTNVLNNLIAGVTVLLIHTAYDDREMQAMTIDHPEWGSAWRQEDFDFFTSSMCKELLERNGIQLITWREIRDKLLR